jgi:hypothetical protein
VTDSATRGEGLGSRYFTVLNAASNASVLAQASAAAALELAPALERGAASSVEDLPLASEPVWARTGTNLHAPYAEVLPDQTGVRTVALAEFGRLELWLGQVDAGYLVANGTLRDLPPGSQLDRETGQFTWAPGPGYTGTYRLTFVTGQGQVPFDITISPKASAESAEPNIRMNLDSPQSGTTSAQTLVVAGWALDPQAAFGSGVDAVHVWAQRTDAVGAEPQFLGGAALGGARPDVAQAFGPRFERSGFHLTANLVPGTYEITAYAWNRRTAKWEDARTVTIMVK